MHSADTDDPALPDYEVLRELGSGGFGQVLLARHRVLGRLVAVKKIHSAALSDADSVARFRREALALARLQHPAIVAVFDLRLTETSAVMVMEYVPGQSLHQALSRSVIPAPIAISILGDVADALAAAASVGIVLRDVKPAIVFLLPGGRAKLGDFGISRIADAGVFRTRDGQLTGTPAYMAPESVLSDREPDNHADDYAFAVMAYEVLVGQRPFEGEGLAVLGQHGFVMPHSPMEVLTAFPPAAAEALLGGLEKDPVLRLPARELVSRLRCVPENAWPPPPEPTDAGASTGATLLGKAISPAAARLPIPVPVPLPVPARSSRRRRTVLLAVLGLVLALSVAAATIVARNSASLSIVGAAVTVESAVGHCPSARYLFTATIETNGVAGALELRWRQPDGERTDPTILDVRDGQGAVIARLQFDVTGSQELRGAAELELLSPQRLTAEPVDISYICP
ncbi:MAG: serine/threonine protein kinase [Actinomycetota bacterium]|nr:serine/threonine protein kinase [Actinomycetota bacterium]